MNLMAMSHTRNGLTNELLHDKMKVRAFPFEML